MAIGNRPQLFGAVQDVGLSEPMIRRFKPAGTWFTAPPVCTATQVHGCAVAHNVPGELGQAVVPALREYVGRQPVASSSLRFDTAGSQSSDWFWLPPATRISTIGSFTDEAFARLPLTPIVTTRLCVQLVCAALQRSSEFAPETPSFEIVAILIGPERAAEAENARCTVPNEPLHLFPPVVPQLLQLV